MIAGRMIVLKFLRAVVSFITLSYLLGGASLAASPNYIQPQISSDRVFVFVHGLFGDSLGSWKNSSNQYLWDFVADDPTIKTSNLFAYGFPSKFLSSSFSIDDAADDLEQRLRLAGVLKHKQIIFVAHSMGGLVVEAFLLRYRGVAAQTPIVLLYSTPHEGSEISSIAKLISDNPGLETMISGDKNQYLRRLESDWRNSGFATQIKCAFELKDTYKVRIVTRLSATRPCAGSSTPVDADHIDIVKPINKDSGAVVALRLAISAIPSLTAPTATIAQPTGASDSRPDFRPEARKAVRDYLAYLQAYPALQEEYSNRCLRWRTEMLDVSNSKVTIKNYEFISENCPSQGIRITENTCAAELGNVDDQIVLLGNPKIEIQCLSGECFTCEVLQRSRVPPSLDFSDSVVLPPEKLKAVSVYIGREPPTFEKIPRFSPFARSISRLLSNGDDKKFCQRHSIYCQ